MRTYGLIVLTACFTLVLCAQIEMVTPKNTDQSNIFIEVQSFASDAPGKTCVDLYVQVPYQELKFVKEGEEYVATYQVLFAADDQENNRVWDKDAAVEVRVRDFAQTTSTKLNSLRQMTAEIPPGSYLLNVVVQDRESRRELKSRKKITVRNFETDSIGISDLLLVNRLVKVGEKTSIVPNISGMLGESAEGFHLYFELYDRSSIDSFIVNCSILDLENKPLVQRQGTQIIRGTRSQVFFNVDSLKLPVGKYIVRVDAYDAGAPRNAQSIPVASAWKTFSVRWSNIPFSITDIEKAIDQLRYVAKDDEINEIREADTPEERRERFLDFWEKRDPDPHTKRNELMEEYYSRIEQSNRLFSAHLEGWRSDRGMVYVRYGPPDNVERHPFETNSRPYEIWYYYQRDIKFMFVDMTGFGDFRLEYPQTDLWGRMR